MAKRPIQCPVSTHASDDEGDTPGADDPGDRDILESVHSLHGSFVLILRKNG